MSCRKNARSLYELSSCNHLIPTLKFGGKGESKMVILKTGVFLQTPVVYESWIFDSTADVEQRALMFLIELVCAP